MGPLLIAEESRHPAELTDLVVELVGQSAGFRRSLPDGVLTGLATLVRATNCYYSNLIEGHNTHPVDIERALEGDYSTEPEQRNLQLEAKAHIEVQKWIDGDGLKDRAVKVAGLTETHRRFCRLLPDSLRWIEEPDTKERVDVVPGHFRGHHVRVGRHSPVNPGVVPRFLDRFEAVYSRLGTMETVMAAAAAHHRLLGTYIRVLNQRRATNVSPDSQPNAGPVNDCDREEYRARDEEPKAFVSEAGVQVLKPRRSRH